MWTLRLAERGKGPGAGIGEPVLCPVEARGGGRGTQTGEGHLRAGARQLVGMQARQTRLLLPSPRATLAGPRPSSTESSQVRGAGRCADTGALAQWWWARNMVRLEDTLAIS